MSEAFPRRTSNILAVHGSSSFTSESVSLLPSSCFIERDSSFLAITFGFSKYISQCHPTSNHQITYRLLVASEESIGRHLHSNAKYHIIQKSNSNIPDHSRSKPQSRYRDEATYSVLPSGNLTGNFGPRNFINTHATCPTIKIPLPSLANSSLSLII